LAFGDIRDRHPVTPRGLADWDRVLAAAAATHWDDLAARDTRGMLAAIAGFPQQCSPRASDAARQGLDLPANWKPEAVVFTGMGGSALGGELLAALIAHEGRVPAVTSRGYELPVWVNQQTLVVVSSYSGETEETLAAFREAVARGAMILAVTSGGRLATEAEEKQHEGARVAAYRVQPGLAPRAALGHMLIPAMTALEVLGLVPSQGDAVMEATGVLTDMARDTGWTRALAAAVHAALEAGAPVTVYGNGALGQVAAYRWQTQINENAKALIHHHAFPEMCHNEIMGWEGVPAGGDAAPVVIMLRAGADHPRNALRQQIVSDILAEKAAIYEVTAQGESVLAQVLSLIYAGDWVSAYLALLRGIDPTSIDSINLLKARLAQHA